VIFLAQGRVPDSNLALYDAALRQWWTYGQLQENVSRLSRALEYPKKALAFSFCRNDSASLAWYLACVDAGHAVALLDEGLADDFKTRLISLYAPEFILSSVNTTDYGAGFSDCQYEALHPAETGNYFWRRKATPDQALHPDLALLLSTSGSTGSPKFVRLTKGNVLSNAESISEALAIHADDRAISSLPVHYSYGLSVVNTHLLAGATLVLTNERLLARTFWDIFQQMRCTSFAGVPYSYQILHRLGLENLNVTTLRTMTQAGGKLHNDLIARFHERMDQRRGRFFVMYGQTEATARIAILPAECLPAKLGSAGLPIPGGRFSIDVDGRLTTEPNRAGELIYTGPNVMMGYATSRADLAQGDALGGRLFTGDAAYMDEDGFLYINGRMKRDVKLFGLRLNLDEIEAILRVHGPTAVIARGEKLRIFCEYGDDTEFARHRHELAARLKMNHLAFEFCRIDRLPMNTNGKIDYRVLADRP
jgi:long-chain acyl-CoA synthetase